MRHRVGWVLLLVLALAAASTEAGPFRTPRQGDAAGDALRAVVGTGPVVTNYKSGCTASLNCSNGAFLFCSSGVPGTCSVGSNWVECNGNRTYCPLCTITRVCCDGTEAYCEGYQSCSYIFRGVKCDGVSYQDCPPIKQCAF